MVKKKIQFIVNPISGVGRQKTIEKLVPQFLDLQQFEYQICYTQYAGHATLLAKEICQTDTDIIAVVGGDGSINEVVSGMIGSDKVLALIPTGSGNGLARFLKTPLNIGRDIKLINNLNVKEIDTMSINGKCCVSIAGLGFDALVAKKFSTFHQRGFWGYMKIVGREYFIYKPKEYTLHVNGEIFKRKALMISLANSNQFGFETVVAPTADITDGLMDICVIKKVPLGHIIINSIILFAKKIHKTRYVEIIKAAEVIIKRDGEDGINVDGQHLELGKDLHVKMHPRSLKIILP